MQNDVDKSEQDRKAKTNQCTNWNPIVHQKINKHLKWRCGPSLVDFKHIEMPSHDVVPDVLTGVLNPFGNEFIFAPFSFLYPPLAEGAKTANGI